MKTEDAEKKYGDIIHLPHHVSSVHPHMPVSDRAAQFAPFAALTGYGEVIKETARQTDERPDLSEDEKQELNYKIQLACALPGEKPEIVLTYFVQDEKKSGGACHTARGKIRRIDPDAGQIILEDGMRIRLDCVVDIEFTGQLSQSALWKSDMPME
ncbi:MAG TPA: YolD-like family protein [Candidatus Mediterraneibacter merdigallinarum]|nr:YolD-like family protein [Candidatus Mediterraneibacter merdigallinarum]